jgi:hypothetical protein
MTIGDLHECDLRKVGPFAVELCIYRVAGLRRDPPHKLSESCVIFD